MSSHEQALASLLSQLAFSFDGAILGAALAYAAVRSFIKLTATSSSLQRLRRSPSLSVPDLRSLVQRENQVVAQHDELVIVRGQVEAKSSVDGTRKGFMANNDGLLVSKESGDKAVVVQRTQSCIYNEWRGFLGWTSDVRALLGRSRREQESSSFRMVPFVLVESGKWPISDYVVVNMVGSRHPLPLTTVYHQLQPIASPYTFLQALFGHEYPVGLLDEEKILPLGKVICAVGMCSSKNGIPEIRPCDDLPYFLSDLTKDQMVADLAFKAKILLWSGIILGSMSVGILSYAVIRNWNRWKEWRRWRLTQHASHISNDEAATEIDADEETGDVPDGQLCVICLMRRRRAAFIPCGHMVCCRLCAFSVERDVSPKCPLCRQAIRNSIRIFEC